MSGGFVLAAVVVALCCGLAIGILIGHEILVFHRARNGPEEIDLVGARRRE